MSASLEFVNIDNVLSLDNSEHKSEIITIITNDDVKIDLDKQLATHSGLISILLEDKECQDVKLEMISSQEFCVVVRYLELLKNNKASDIPKPIIDTTLKSYLSSSQLDFINDIYKEGMLAKIASVSNYLDIKSLLDLCCAKIASLLKGKINSPEIDEIIKTL